MGGLKRELSDRLWLSLALAKPNKMDLNPILFFGLIKNRLEFLINSFVLFHSWATSNSNWVKYLLPLHSLL